MRLVIYLFFLVPGFGLLAQNRPPISIKKENHGIIFFNKNSQNDTVLKNKSDQFYLSVPPNLIEDIAILIENGMLQAMEADSVFRLSYVKGIKYEAEYVQERPGSPGQGPVSKKYKLKSLVNGASTSSDNRISVEFYDRKAAKSLLKNEFVYFEK